MKMARAVVANVAARKGKTCVEKQTAAAAAAEEEEAGDVEGKTVVVAIRMDSQSRELLTWALIKAAVPGDRVVALHVLSSSSTSAAGVAASANRHPAAVFSLAKELDDMLAVYEGFCSLKQIDLKLKVCKGSSIRKILVSEAKAFSASILILGVAKSSHVMGSPSISVAKFCAKKLPRDCSVVALSEGKIFFQREAADISKSPEKSNKESSNVNREENNEMFCLLPIVNTKRINDKDCKPSCVPEDELNSCSISSVKNDSSSSRSQLRNNCSICAPEADPAPLGEPKKEEASTLVPVDDKFEASASSSMTIVVKDSREARHAWPSLRRLVLISKKGISSEKYKSSMVQWAKRHSSVHPDSKNKKSDRSAALNLDGQSGAVVEVDADSPPPVFLLRDSKGRLPEELESLEQKYSSVCRSFTHEELVQATSNFSQENLIGKGGSSSVYKAHLSDGKELAVKILKPSLDAVREFVTEIEIITTLHHKNIISLFGFCFEHNSLMLVYDYASRGSLEDILHGEDKNRHVLSWPERYKVAIGVAEALDHLHGGGCTEPVIHRDVKSSNILLSEDFEPQLSDFGLAKWASASTSQPICGDVAGTFGYLAPEYILYGKVNKKIDVYAFGVVLLELLSGRKPINAGCPKGQESLVMWAEPILQEGDVKKLIDPNLKHEFDSDQVERMILSASLCVRRLHSARPQIAMVLKLLKGDGDAIEWAKSELKTQADDGILNLESDIRSHLNLALLDVEDDSISLSSTDQTVDSLTMTSSVENYLQWRWSRSSSFD